jgi:hypothetical protein
MQRPARSTAGIAAPHFSQDESLYAAAQKRQCVEIQPCLLCDSMHRSDKEREKCRISVAAQQRKADNRSREEAEKARRDESNKRCAACTSRAVASGVLHCKSMPWSPKIPIAPGTRLDGVTKPTRVKFQRKSPVVPYSVPKPRCPHVKLGGGMCGLTPAHCRCLCMLCQQVCGDCTFFDDTINDKRAVGYLDSIKLVAVQQDKQMHDGLSQTSSNSVSTTPLSTSKRKNLETNQSFPPHQRHCSRRSPKSPQRDDNTHHTDFEERDVPYDGNCGFHVMEMIWKMNFPQQEEPVGYLELRQIICDLMEASAREIVLSTIDGNVIYIQDELITECESVSEYCNNMRKDKTCCGLNEFAAFVHMVGRARCRCQANPGRAMCCLQPTACAYTYQVDGQSALR